MFWVVYQFRWTNLYLLNSGCESGFYGLNCTDLCSSHCENNDPCDHISGVCPNGCQDGYIGARCNNSKNLDSFVYNNIVHIELLILNNNANISVDYTCSLQSGKLWEKLLFSMFFKLQWNMWTYRWIMWGLQRRFNKLLQR